MYKRHYIRAALHRTSFCCQPSSRHNQHLTASSITCEYLKYITINTACYSTAHLKPHKPSIQAYLHLPCRNTAFRCWSPSIHHPEVSHKLKARITHNPSISANYPHSGNSSNRLFSTFCNISESISHTKEKPDHTSPRVIVAIERALHFTL